MNILKLPLMKVNRILYSFLFILAILSYQKVSAQYALSIDGCQGDVVNLDLNSKTISFKLLRDTFFIAKATDGSLDTIFVYMHPKPSVKAGTIPVLCNDTSAIDLSYFGSKVPIDGKGVWYLNSKPVAVVNNTLYPDQLSAGHYTLTYTVYDKYNCKSSDTTTLGIRQCKVVSVQEQPLPSTNINIFPNPTTGILNLKFVQSINEEINCTICNMYGMPLMSIRLTAGINAQNIDLSTLPSGIYILVVKANDNCIYKEIIKG